MSADRYEITDADHGQMRITDSHGEHVYLNPVASRTSAASVGAIRQQARDIEQLRTDLAAAVAERDEWCRRAKLSEAKEALAEARLAAIDGAPTVATVCVVPSTQRVYVSADVEQYELPPIGTHLIARPAKD